MAPVKAVLQALEPGTNNPKSGKQYRVEAHFNPQSLRVTYRKGGASGTNTRIRQIGTQGATEQQTGYSSEISMDLLFDTSQSGDDVRNTTLNIAAMIRPDVKQKGKSKSAPPVPVVRFSWGTFIFTGNIQSMNETLDLFSEQGVPLRATVNLSMSEVALERSNPSELAPSSAQGYLGGAGPVPSAGAGFTAGASLGAGIAVGTTPLTLSQSGDTLQSLAGRAGISGSWKAIASANNIDNPRLMDPGTVLNLNIGIEVEL